MKSWLFLAVAIVGEVVATSALKSSEGFTKLVPSAVVVVGYGVAFYFLSLALRFIPVGIAYAVWAGLGIVLVAGIAWLPRTKIRRLGFRWDWPNSQWCCRPQLAFQGQRSLIGAGMTSKGILK